MTVTTSTYGAGARIAAWRRAAGWSQQRLADHVGVSRSYLGDVEAGRSEPSGALLTSLTSTTDVSADWVLTGEGKMERGVPAEAAEEGGAYNVVETQLAARVRALVVALGSLDKIHQEAILAQAISRAELTRQVAELVTAVSKLEEHITRNGAR